MKHMIRLTNHTATDIMDIFHIADEIRQGKHADILKGKVLSCFSRNKHPHKSYL